MAETFFEQTEKSANRIASLRSLRTLRAQENGRVCEEPEQLEEIKIAVFYNGEFDPGSGRTLAAGLTHASRRGSRVLALW